MASNTKNVEILSYRRNHTTIFDKDSIKTSFPSFLDKVSDLGAKII